MKLVSFYLPQFHEIPENNDAWGNGFTEWVNVKKARQYYDWQVQPRIPLNENYYNLLDVNTIRWQASLAQDAGVDAFCFYHYWFGGRMVLEKPVKMLRDNEDIDIQYCFSWANEPWTKTWHGAGGEKEILIPQKYGYKEEWDVHYNYFKDYFADSRYLKNANRPILVVYRLRNIPDFNGMIRYWNERAIKDGFDGIFIISMNVSSERVFMSKWVNGSVDFEPNKTKYEMSAHEKNQKVIDYIELNEKMLQMKHQKNHFRTVFINYDDTPRRGENGICTKNSSPKLFGKYLSKNIELSKNEGNEYLFINAWNEWGEGNYLEPDELWKTSYLDEIRRVMSEQSIN